MKNIQKSWQHSYWIEELGSRVDFANSEEKWILEVDGPTHFLSNGVQRPQDQLRDRILKSLGWHVFRISYSEWSKAKDKNAFLRKMFKISGPSV